MDYLYEYISEKLLKFAVVPHAGTWIEINKIVVRKWNLQSFPTRERGLKCTYRQQLLPMVLSFPTRERGLKYIEVKRREKLNMSFPTRERGLKLHIRYSIGINSRRSPRGNVD